MTLPTRRKLVIIILSQTPLIVNIQTNILHILISTTSCSDCGKYDGYNERTSLNMIMILHTFYLCYLFKVEGDVVAVGNLT